MPTLLMELKQLTINYAKQETLEPLKGLKRFLALGAAGSLTLGMGLLLWVLAVLRALQNETGRHLTGHLSWVPYLVTLVACAVVIALAVFAIGKDRRDAQKRKERAAAVGRSEAR